jgi:hypothetical protein
LSDDIQEKLTRNSANTGLYDVLVQIRIAGAGKLHSFKPNQTRDNNKPNTNM